MQNLILNDRSDVRKKLSEERNREYNEFKKEYESKLKNRFAQKKNLSPIKTQSNNDTNFVVEDFNRTFRKDQIDSPNLEKVVDDSRFQMNTKGNLINTLLMKMDTLQTNVNELVQMKPNDKNYEYSSHGGYNYEYDKYIRGIDEAQQKLNALELEYSGLKNEAQKQNFKYKQFESFPGNRSVSLERHNVSRDLTYKEKQEIYRKELEQQMAEKAKSKHRKSIINEEQFYDGFPSFSNVKSSNRTDKIVPEISNSYATPADQEYFFLASRDLFKSLSQNDLRTINLSAPKMDKSELPPFIHMNPRGTGEIINNDEKLKKSLYAEELKRQIEETNKRKQEMKRKEEEFNKRKEKEIAEFDPFSSPKRAKYLQESDQSFSGSLKLPLNSTPNVQNGPNFARGGHGIFGQPLTDTQKSSAEKYKQELAAQISEKKKKAELERKQQELYEKKEIDRINRQNQLIEDEINLEKKQRNQNASNYEQIKNNIESVEKSSNQRDNNLSTNVKSPESNSIGRHRVGKNLKNDLMRLSSPDLLIGPPTFPKTTAVHSRFHSNPNRNSNNIIEKDKIYGGIKQMERELLDERKKVEEELKKRANRVEIFDERIYRKSVRKNKNSIFDAALGKKPVKFSQKASKSSLEESFSDDDHELLDYEDINKLLHAGQVDSRVTKLEHDQALYLKKQDQYLAKLRKELKDRQHNQDDKLIPELNVLKRIPNRDKVKFPLDSLQIKSNSAFIGLEEVFNPNDKLSRDLISLDSKSESSLNLNELIKRNEDRIRNFQKNNENVNVYIDESAPMKVLVSGREDSDDERWMLPRI